MQVAKGVVVDILINLLSLEIKVNFEECYLLPDRLCGLVVRVLGYRSGSSGSIPGTTRRKK
jgi:hypothetical protein